MPSTRSQVRASNSQVSDDWIPTSSSKKHGRGRPRKSQADKGEQFRPSADCWGTKKTQNSADSTFCEDPNFKLTSMMNNKQWANSNSFFEPGIGTHAEFARNATEEQLQQEDDAIQNQSFADMFFDEKPECNAQKSNFAKCLVNEPDLNLEIFQQQENVKRKQAKKNSMENLFFVENSESVPKRTREKNPVVLRNHQNSEKRLQPDNRGTDSKRPVKNENPELNAGPNVKTFKPKHTIDQFAKPCRTPYQVHDRTALWDEPHAQPLEIPSNIGERRESDVDMKWAPSAPLPFHNFTLTLAQSSESSAASQDAPEEAMDLDIPREGEKEEEGNREEDSTEIIPASVEDNSLKFLFRPWNWLQKDEQQMLHQISSEMVGNPLPELSQELFENLNSQNSKSDLKMAPISICSANEEASKHTSAEAPGHQIKDVTENPAEVKRPQSEYPPVMVSSKSVSNKTGSTQNKRSHKKKGGAKQKKPKEQKGSQRKSSRIRNKVVGAAKGVLTAVANSQKPPDNSQGRRATKIAATTKTLIKPSVLSRIVDLHPQNQAEVSVKVKNSAQPAMAVSGSPRQNLVQGGTIQEKVETLQLSDQSGMVQKTAAIAQGFLSFHSLANREKDWWRTAGSTPLSGTVPKLCTNSADRPSEQKLERPANIVVKERSERLPSFGQWNSIRHGQGVPNERLMNKERVLSSRSTELSEGIAVREICPAPPQTFGRAMLHPQRSFSEVERGHLHEVIPQPNHNQNTKNCGVGPSNCQNVQSIRTHSQGKMTMEDYNSHPMHSRQALNGKNMVPELLKEDSQETSLHLYQRDLAKNLKCLNAEERSNHSLQKAHTCDEADSEFLRPKTPKKLAQRKSTSKAKSSLQKRKKKTVPKSPEQGTDKTMSSSVKVHPKTQMSPVQENGNHIFGNPFHVSFAIPQCPVSSAIEYSEESHSSWETLCRTTKELTDDWHALTSKQLNFNLQTQPLDLTTKPRSGGVPPLQEPYYKGGTSACDEKPTSIPTSTTENSLLNGEARSEQANLKEPCGTSAQSQNDTEAQTRLRKEIEEMINQIKYVRTPQEGEYIEAANIYELINEESLEW